VKIEEERLPDRIGVEEEFAGPYSFIRVFLVKRPGGHLEALRFDSGLAFDLENDQAVGARYYSCLGFIKSDKRVSKF